MEPSVNSLLGRYSTFYAVTAGLLGTVFALLFSFSLFAVQHAASNYAPGLLDDFKNDRRTKATFAFFVIAVALNLVLVAWPTANLLTVLGTLALALLSLISLARLYYYTIDLINPLRLAERLHDRAQATLRAVLGVPAGQKTQVPKAMRNVYDDLEGLFDLVHRAVDKWELQTSRRGLDALCGIADEYCKATKTVARSRDHFLLGLPGVCERLFSLVTVAVKSENVLALSQIVYAYQRIAVSTLQVQSTPSPLNRTHDLACHAIGGCRTARVGGAAHGRRDGGCAGNGTRRQSAG